MTNQESEKAYRTLCVEYGKEYSSAELAIFQIHVKRLNPRQYRLVLRRVETYINDIYRKPMPSWFRRAISELTEEANRRNRNEEMQKKYDYPAPDDLDPRFAVFYAFETWATEFRCVHGRSKLRKGNASALRSFRKRLDDLYFPGALNGYKSLVNKRELQEYISYNQERTAS